MFFLVSGLEAIRLMVKILHDLKDLKLWELRYIPYFGSCRILAITIPNPPKMVQAVGDCTGCSWRLLIPVAPTCRNLQLLGLGWFRVSG